MIVIMPAPPAASLRIYCGWTVELTSIEVMTGFSLDNPTAIDRTWNSILPDLRAALAVALFVIVLEVVGDVIPVAGWFATLPFDIPVYLFQGILAGVFYRQAAHGFTPRAWNYLGIGARSALWTGLISLVTAFVTVLAMLPVSLGAVLVGLPAVGGSFVVDLGLNLVFSALGAWIYSLTGGRRASGIACLLSTVLAAGGCMLAVGLVIWVILSAVGVLPRPIILH
jgi:hypothetical protein